MSVAPKSLLHGQCQAELIVALNIIVVSAQGLVSMTQQQVGGVAAPILSQPGVATPTVYSLAPTQPTMAPQQYTTQQIQVANVQVGTYLIINNN